MGAKVEGDIDAGNTTTPLGGNPAETLSAAAGPAAGPFTNTTSTFAGLGATAAGGAPVGAILGIMQQQNMASSPQAVTEYVEKVNKAIGEKLARIERGSDYKIDTMPLGTPNGAYAYLCTGFDGQRYGFVQTYEEASGPALQNMAPNGNYLDAAVQQLLARNPNVKLRGMVNVTPDMYSRPEHMASAIINSFVFRVRDDLLKMSAQELLGSLELSVSLNLTDARNLENQYSPHGVRPASDIGLVVYVKTRKTDSALLGATETNLVPIASVLAITDFGGPIQGSEKMMPMVRITDITCPIPHPGLLAMVMELAGEYLVKNGHWLTPYRSYGTKNALNIGPLDIAADGRSLVIANNDQDTQTVLARRCISARLFIDISMGRYRIPELMWYGPVGNSGRDAIISTACNFFRTKDGVLPTPTAQQLPTITTHMSTDYTGTYGDANGELTDSRTITYLKLIALGSSVDADTKRILQNYSLQPKDRAECISRLTGNRFNSLYATNIEFVAAQYLTWISGAMQHCQITLQDTYGNNNGMSLSSITDAMADYGTIGSTAQTGGLFTLGNGGLFV